MQIVATVGPLLVGLTAVLGLAAGLTKTARLRRQEELLRRAIGALTETSTQRPALADLHLEVVSAIAARQICGRWPFIWPWITLAGAVVAGGQTGYFAAKYVTEIPSNGRARGSVASEVFGDTSVAGAVITSVLGVMVLGWFFSVYESRLVERAEIESEFRSSGRLRRPTVSLTRSALAQMPAQDRAELTWRESGRAVLTFVAHFTPGIALLATGFLVGITLYAKVYVDGLGPDALERLTAYSIFAMSFSCVAAMSVLLNTRLAVEGAGETPETYPVKDADTYGEPSGYL